MLKLDERLQIMATTHSPFVLDDFAGEEVVVLATDEARGTRARLLSEHADFERFRDSLRPGELGFDPIEEQHRLSSAPKSRKEAKTVARRLYGDTPPIVDRRGLDVLSKHELCGAAPFLRELRSAVVEPIVGAHEP
ncbi:MAG: hypothetical protein OHK0013_27600 [Sandaracinaceae bacterium]